MTKECDWKPFCALMRTAAKMCATEAKDTDALAMMFVILSGYSFEQVKRAVFQHFKTKDGKFFPTPAHIIAIIEGNEDDRAEVAWRTFRRSVEKLGGYESVRFPSPAYHYAIRELGGWQKINSDFTDMTEKDIEFFGKNFKRLFLIGERNSNWENVPSYFQGAFESNNSFLGYGEFIPPVIEATTGKKLDRGELLSRALPGRGELTSLVEGVKNNLTEGGTHDGRND